MKYKFRKTKKCVFCFCNAETWSGFVLKNKNEAVFAGWCGKKKCKNEGFVGHWLPKMKIEKEEKL